MITQLEDFQDGGSQVKINTHKTALRVHVKVDGAKIKMEMLEERLRAIEGRGSFGFRVLADLCLVRDVIIPPKFKVPEFEKYKGTSCPKSHLAMYCKKMAAYAHDGNLLIHLFQDSLIGISLSWYIHLEPTCICSWKDLVDAFLK